MLKLKSTLWLISSLVVAFTSLKVSAYDEDTHFYGTYSVARFAGIGHPVAMKLALAAQWMDESFLSDPMSMIVLPIDGVHKRRLLHFPSQRIVGTVAAKTQAQSFGFELNGIKKLLADRIIQDSGADFKPETVAVHTQTEANNEFASALLRQGLREGNLMKAGASLHTIEDSYAHAGTSAEIGHTALWHWPDRPFADVSKYFDMVHVLFTAMVAIREQLPQIARDCIVLGDDHCKLGANELSDRYENNEYVKITASADVLRSLIYIRPVMQSFIQRSVEAGYLRPEKLPMGVTFNSLLEEYFTEKAFFVGRMDTSDVLAFYIRKLIEVQGGLRGEIIDIQLIPRDMGLITDPHVEIEDYIESLSEIRGLNGGNGFIKKIVRRILTGYVPVPLSGTHKEEIENDFAPPRRLEMEIRNQNMQRLIQQLYGVKLQFVPSNTKDEEGFVKEVLLDPSGRPNIENREAGVEYATFSLEEKNRFNNVIFGYLYPSLPEGSLKIIVNGILKIKNEGILTAYQKFKAERDKILGSDEAFYERFWKVGLRSLSLGYEVVAGAKTDVEVYEEFRPLLRPYFKDLITAQMKPRGDELNYQKAALNAKTKQRLRVLEKNPKLYPEFLIKGTDVWNEASVGIKRNHLR